jgi:hypothetical protein
MNKIFLTILILIMLSLPGMSQQAVRELHLIPVPKYIEMKPGNFEFSQDMTIRVKDLNNIGLEDFSNLLKAELGSCEQVPCPRLCQQFEDG